MTPANGGATRRARLVELLRGRAFGYALALGTIGGLVAGAVLRSPLLMVAAPVVAAAVIVAVAVRVARGRAAADFFTAFAAGHGLTYWRDWELPPLTPLLGAGDRRHCTHFMQGPLGSGLECGLGHYTFETREGADEEAGARWRAHHFTVCMVDLEPAITLFPGVFLQRRRDMVGRLTEENWLERHGREPVELESVAFTDRYELLVDRHQDALLLRELFSPSFIVWLAGHPLAPCFEYRAGALVVYLRGRRDDAGGLNLLLDATTEIACRIRAEVEERSGAVA